MKSQDQDQNGIPDECQDSDFVRGDCSGNGIFNIADAIVSLNYLFGQIPVSCDDACDANDDEIVNIADAVFKLAALFSGGALPAEPFPGCGPDPEGALLGCESYGAACP